MGIGVAVLLAVMGTAALQAEELTSKDVDVLMRKASEAYKAEQIAEAIEFYRQAADWGNAWGQNNLAWILATFRQEKFRNGSLALYYARKAADQEPKNPAFVRTLAAAYARIGDFDKAVALQKRMLELTEAVTTLSDELKETIRADHQGKLDLYQRGYAYIDPQ
ncbi:hypothetical protein CSB45_10730 [candidate division KSB3 bacterium]|uniref:Uncharacterized protein n=1 Tax=candidate division KSB3 bacterium TaxID=2044937 RepID=A0A2G6E3S8_9BACT|nr:MAG: hypothetical protein CSB45_10730 [candidate division KSB3 bacterium]PIE29117.1 MAG: hypothetical protein CSA57_09895 [candidate division KSB3 bacterium]